MAPTADGPLSESLCVNMKKERRRGWAQGLIIELLKRTRTRSHGWHPSQSTAIQGKVHSLPHPPARSFKEHLRINREYFEPQMVVTFNHETLTSLRSAWQQNDSGKKSGLIVVIITELCFHAPDHSRKPYFPFFKPARLAWTSRTNWERFFHTAVKGLMWAQRSGKNISIICFWTSVNTWG